MKRPLPAAIPVRTKFSTLVAVCEECSGGKRFAKSLRGAYKAAGTRDVRVVRSTCLDICPKRGVTIATLRDGALSVSVIDDELRDRAAIDAVS